MRCKLQIQNSKILLGGFLLIAAFSVLFGGVSRVSAADATLNTGCGNATGSGATVTANATALTDNSKNWQPSSDSTGRWVGGQVTLTGTVGATPQTIRSTGITASTLDTITVLGWDPSLPLFVSGTLTYTVTAKADACRVGTGADAKDYACLQVGDAGYCKGPCDAVPAVSGNSTDCKIFTVSGSQSVGWEGTKCTGTVGPPAVPGVCLEGPRSSSVLPETAPATTGAGLLNLIDSVTNWFFAIFIVLALIFILLAAFQLVTAGGDEAKLGEARAKLIWAAVGIMVALISKGLVPIIRSIVGG